ncbi:glycosyltransferase family 2 protein [Mucilaginibacter antarcticus]|uniref:Glycosyltransferase family 2 protein n=1 Tax=Mucilaginibacter antarcticus TaxID=1855725 RepID=A0ABW5XQU6_9SPHI
MDGNPLVSIIIPAYNAEEYIAETLASAMAQTWANKEIIVINSGSTDNTAVVIKRFGEAVTVLTLPQNKGAATARNAGLAIAKGQYIQFLDADDLLSPDKIERQLKALNNSITQLAICKTVYFNNGDDYKQVTPLYSWYDTDVDDTVDFLVKLYAGEDVMPGYGGMVTVHAWLTPAEVIKKAGPWKEELSVDDDGEFFSRVVLASNGIRYSDRALCYYRKFADNRSLSSQRTLEAIESSIKAIDLKYAHLKARLSTNIADRVFARHYWQVGILAYPRFKAQSAKCIKMARQLGYKGVKYSGGTMGQLVTKVFGWKAARLLSGWYWARR